MIPRWIPQTTVGGGVLEGRPYLREQLEGEGLRFICRSFHQDIEFWVPKVWLYVAKFEHWYWQREWWLYALVVRAGFLELNEGDYYRNGRWTWRFWQRIEAQAYRCGFRDANRHALAELAKRDKREFRRGRRNGFFLGQEYYRRFMLRHLRDLKRDVREVRESLTG